MRKVIFVGFLVLGAMAGMLSSWDDRWGLKIVMMAIGAMFGAAIGGGLSKLGKIDRSSSNFRSFESGDVPGSLGTSGEDLSANYWRDKGLPPFVRGRDAEPDTHMFDPDNIGP